MAKYLHERCLSIIYSNKSSSNEELLEKDKSVYINHRNLQGIATEVLK